jgi:gliding motility-associated-like protein
MKNPYQAPAFLSLFFILYLSTSVFSQNLIPNPSFENSSLSDCPPSPEDALHLAIPWYNVFQGSDFFVNDCSPDYLIFRDPRPAQAYSGSSHVGIWASTYSTGLADGDAFGVELIEPLEDKMYYFSTYVHNRGTLTPDQPNVFCPTVPSRHIGVYISTDSIYGINVVNPMTQEVEDVYIEGDFVWADSSLNIIQTVSGNGEWFKIGGCLKASGGEKHLAIAPPFGQLEFEAGCPFFAYGEFFFQTYFYDFDQVHLEVLPSSFEVNTTVCKEEGTLVDLVKLIPDNRLRNGTIIWDDGSVSDSKLLQEAGIYQVKLLLECGSIPIQLTVNNRKCNSNLFVPNAFTPNSDSHNDLFQPFIDPAGIVQNYEFRVYNRSGKLMFASDIVGEGWDGMYQGEEMDEGVYVWQLKFAVMEQSTLNKIEEVGDVTLIR